MKILVTGASRGIGLAIAKKFDENGNGVFINGRDYSRLENVLPLFKNAVPISADVGDFDAVKAMFEKIGDIDVLVNNAGVSLNGLFQTQSPIDWDAVLNVNLKGVLNCSKFAAESMVRRKSGVIINISSIWGGVGASCEAVYAASKGAVNAFTKSLAKELAPCGVRVNAIACGVIETEMNGFLRDDERAALENSIPAGRFGLPEEIAETAAFLASERAAYLTGQIVAVDGGMV